MKVKMEMSIIEDTISDIKHFKKIGDKRRAEILQDGLIIYLDNRITQIKKKK